MSRTFSTNGRLARSPQTRRRVLYLTNSSPFPPHGGGQLREANLIQRLAKSADIELVVLTENFDRDLAHIEVAKRYCTSVSIFETEIKPGERLRADVPERVGRYQSVAFDDSIKRRINQGGYDVIHAEGYFIATHLPKHLTAPLVLIEENIEYDLDRQHEEPWHTTENLERDMWERATLVGAVSMKDLRAMQEQSVKHAYKSVPRFRPSVGARYTPNGFDHIKVDEPRIHTTNNYTVSLVGNFGWRPTEVSGYNLAHGVWPRVRARLPSATLSLVGAGLNSDFRGDGVILVGEVPSVKPYLIETDVFACPVDTGSGIRVKMVEALATGCAIVCSPKALQGLPDEARDAVLVARGRDQFAAAIVDLLTDSEKRNELSYNAFIISQKMPTWESAADDLSNVWNEAVELTREVRAGRRRRRSASPHAEAPGASSARTVTSARSLVETTTPKISGLEI